MTLIGRSITNPSDDNINTNKKTQLININFNI